MRKRLDESVVDEFEGTINASAFIQDLLNDLPDTRREPLLSKIWNLLDPNQTNSTSRAQIAEIYDSRSFNEGCAYIGRYTDPNHAGGFRVITLLDEMLGDKRLANCEGIGGQGEPPSFMLPSWINADNSIVIDFSAPPKGGPKDFVGNWDEDGIKFVKDGNKWPKVPTTKEEDVTNLLKRFPNYSEEAQQISKQDFFTLYKEVQLNFKSEDKFIGFLCKCWNVTE